MSNILEESKTRAFIKNEGVDYNTAVTTHEIPIEEFTDNLEINVISLDEEDITFDVKGIDPAFANALRRIFISEIPTMAIEKVNMWQNTTVIPDEVLAHRMGLVPIKVDPRLFQEKAKGEEHTEEN